MDLILPFKTGDFAEARSSLKGYKGAWFRCKINDMRVTKSGHLECYLEYIDYPGEEKKWTRVFRKNPACCKQESSASRQIMLHPPFPQWYRGDQVPEHFPNRDAIASVCDTWKVGDLIDWLCEGCYWTGKITRLINEDEVEVELLEPPIGEGGCYDANCKDLRPALDWFLEKGWTVPLSQANGKCWYAARLIHHKSDTEKSNTDEQTTSDDDKEEVHKSLKRESNISQEAPGYSNLKPSSDTNSISKLNNQTDTIVTSMAKFRPSSKSKSSDPSNGAQAAIVSNQPGTHSSSKRHTSPTDLVSVQSPDTVKDARAELDGLSNGIRVPRYPLRSAGTARSTRLTSPRKFVEESASGKQK